MRVVITWFNNSNGSDGGDVGNGSGVATMAMAVASSVMAATMGRSRGGGAESRSMRGTDARGGGAEEWHVSRR